MNGAFALAVLDPAKVPGIVYLVPVPKSPHGVDVAPDGNWIASYRHLADAPGPFGDWDVFVGRTSDPAQPADSSLTFLLPDPTIADLFPRWNAASNRLALWSIDSTIVAGDATSYRYLAESIRMHPDQDALKAMMEAAGLARGDEEDLGLVDDLRQLAGAQHRHGVDDDRARFRRRQPAGDHGRVVGPGSTVNEPELIDLPSGAVIVWTLAACALAGALMLRPRLVQSL